MSNNPDGREEALWEEKLAAWLAEDARTRVEWLHEWCPNECAEIDAGFIADHLEIDYTWEDWATALEDIYIFQSQVEYWWEWER